MTSGVQISLPAPYALEVGWVVISAALVENANGLPRVVLMAFPLVEETVRGETAKAQR